MGVRIGNGYLHRIIRTGQDLQRTALLLQELGRMVQSAVHRVKGLVVCGVVLLCLLGVSAGAVRRRGAIWHIAAVSTVVAADHVVVGIRIGGGGVICSVIGPAGAALQRQGKRRAHDDQTCGGGQQPFLIIAFGIGGGAAALGRSLYLRHDAVRQAGGRQGVARQRFAKQFVHRVKGLLCHGCSLLSLISVCKTAPPSKRFPLPSSNSRSRILARLMRDFTVPSLISSAAAISA